MNNFEEEIKERLSKNACNINLLNSANNFMLESTLPKYSYNFNWLGRPIIQYPQDIIAMQELIWRVKPDLIIETGIAHGGSLIFSASMLALLDFEDAASGGARPDPAKSSRRVLGVDIDIRPHNLAAIEGHFLAPYIQMIEGSSIDPEIVADVHKLAKGFKRILICLDSNHTHEHVLAELNAYSNLTTIGSYCVVFDTIIEHISPEMFLDRPWGPGNNPKTAVDEFLRMHPEFEVDASIDAQLLISVAPSGYLKRIY